MAAYDETLAPLIKVPDDASLILAFNDAFEKFLENVKLIPVDRVRASDVLRLYFDAKPPFGLGKKKAEFPDAYSLLAMERWAQRMNAPIYVVSSDNDMQSFCRDSDHLEHVDSVSTLLDRFIREDNEGAAVLSAEIEAVRGHIAEKVSDAIASGPHHLDDIDGEVDTAEVIVIELDEFKIVELGSIESTVNLTAEVEIYFEFTFADYENAIWDSEESRYLSLNHHRACCTCWTDLPCTILLSKDAGALRVIDVTVNDGESIGLTPENDWEPL